MTDSRPITKPGPGWSYLGSAVYEHASGVRVHLQGLVLFPSGLWLFANWPECKRLWDCIRACGGNRRRGVMVWALRLQAEDVGGQSQGGGSDA